MDITLDSLKNVCSDIKENWDAPNDSHTKAEFYGMCVALDMIQKHYQELRDNDKPKWSLTAEQQKELEKKVWEVIPEAKFLDLYSSDFEMSEDWHQVCQVFDKEHITDRLTLLVVGVKTNDF